MKSYQEWKKEMHEAMTAPVPSPQLNPAPTSIRTTKMAGQTMPTTQDRLKSSPEEGKTGQVDIRKQQQLQQQFKQLQNTMNQLGLLK